jgi:hypothetical protein
MVDFILLSSTDTNRIHVVCSTTIQRGVYIVCCEDTADIHDSRVDQGVALEYPAVEHGMKIHISSCK